MADLAVHVNAASRPTQITAVPTFDDCPKTDHSDFRAISETCNTYAAAHLQELFNLGSVIGSAGFESLAIIYQTKQDIELNGPIDEAKLQSYQERRNVIVATMTHAHGSVETLRNICSLFQGVIGYLDEIIYTNEASALATVKDIAEASAKNVTDATSLKATLQGHYITYSGALTALTDRLTSSNNRAYKTQISLDSNRGAPLSFYQATGADNGLLTETDCATKAKPRELGLLHDPSLPASHLPTVPALLVAPDLDLTGETSFRDVATICSDYWTDHRGLAMESGNAICNACFESLTITYQRAKGRELAVQLNEPQDLNTLQLRRNGVVTILAVTKSNAATLTQIGELFTKSVALLDDTIAAKLDIASSSHTTDVKATATRDLIEARTLRATLQFHRVEILGLTAAFDDRQGASTKRALLMQDALDRPWMASTTLTKADVARPLSSEHVAALRNALEVDEDPTLSGAPFPLSKPPSVEDADGEKKKSHIGPVAHLLLTETALTADLRLDERSPPSSPTMKPRGDRDAHSPLAPLVDGVIHPSSPLVVHRAPHNSPTQDDSGGIFNFDLSKVGQPTMVGAEGLLSGEYAKHRSPPESPVADVQRVGTVHVDHKEITAADAPIKMVICQPQPQQDAVLTPTLDNPRRRDISSSNRDDTVPVSEIATTDRQNVTAIGPRRQREVLCCIPVGLAKGLRGLSQHFLEYHPAMRSFHEIGAQKLRTQFQHTRERRQESGAQGLPVIVAQWGASLREFKILQPNQITPHLRHIALHIRNAHTDGQHTPPSDVVLKGVAQAFNTVRNAERRPKDKESERPPSPVDGEPQRRPFVKTDVPKVARVLLSGLTRAAQTVQDRDQQRRERAYEKPPASVVTATRRRHGDPTSLPRVAHALVKGLAAVAQTMRNSVEQRGRAPGSKEPCIVKSDPGPQRVVGEIADAHLKVAAKKEAPLHSPSADFDVERIGETTTIVVEKHVFSASASKERKAPELDPPQDDAEKKNTRTRRRRKLRGAQYSLTGGGMTGQKPPPGWGFEPRDQVSGLKRGFGSARPEVIKSSGGIGKMKGGASSRLQRTHDEHKKGLSQSPASPDVKKGDGEA